MQHREAALLRRGGEKKSPRIIYKTFHSLFLSPFLFLCKPAQEWRAPFEEPWAHDDPARLPELPVESSRGGSRPCNNNKNNERNCDQFHIRVILSFFFFFLFIFYLRSPGTPEPGAWAECGHRHLGPLKKMDTVSFQN